MKFNTCLPKAKGLPDTGSGKTAVDGSHDGGVEYEKQRNRFSTPITLYGKLPPDNPSSFFTGGCIILNSSPFVKVVLIDLPVWSSPFALFRFHGSSLLLRTCPPLRLLIGYFLPCSLCYLCIFTRFLFRTRSIFGFTAVLPIRVAWQPAGSPVPLISLV